jgi:hypothetical protein
MTTRVHISGASFIIEDAASDTVLHLVPTLDGDGSWFIRLGDRTLVVTAVEFERLGRWITGFMAEMRKGRG